MDTGLHQKFQALLSLSLLMETRFMSGLRIVVSYVSTLMNHFRGEVTSPQLYLPEACLESTPFLFCKRVPCKRTVKSFGRNLTIEP